MNHNSKKKLVYVRYIFPVAAILLSFLLMLIPCYSYTTADTGAQALISLCELADNARVQVCEYLFEKVGSKDQANLYFSKLVLGLIVGLSVLFVVAFASTVYILVSAWRYFKTPDTMDTKRLLFVTLVPNRAVGFVFQALALPLLALPHLMVTIYDKVLQYHVELTLTFPDPLIFGIVLYVASIVLSCVSATHEAGLHMNPFSRRKPSPADEDEDEE